jgi:hypothetical protein
MTTEYSAKEMSASRTILYVGATKYLTGNSITSAISKDWQKAGEVASHFDNHGFDLNPEDSVRTIEELRSEIRDKAWNGILLGWCIRGHVEFTALFEQVVSVCVDETRSMEGVKLMFSTGPDNLFETVLRNFPE